MFHYKITADSQWFNNRNIRQLRLSLNKNYTYNKKGKTL